MAPCADMPSWQVGGWHLQFALPRPACALPAEGHSPHLAPLPLP